MHYPVLGKHSQTQLPLPLQELLNIFLDNQGMAHVPESTANTVYAQTSNGNRLAFVTWGSQLSCTGTGKKIFKFPIWDICGNTQVYIIKVNFEDSEKCN